MFKRKQKFLVCLAASAGGHLSQLLRLADGWQGHKVFYVSTLDSVGDKLKRLGRYYITGECNREHPLRTLMVLTKCFRVILDEKPDVIVTTGAAPACLLCLVGKVFGAQIVWVDSIANVAKLSLSGRIIRPFANLFLTQWPELADKYTNVEYAGCVI